MARLKRARGDGDVVEHAKSHAALRLGVMAGRPDQRKDGLAAFDGTLHGDERSARRPARDRERARVHDDVAGREIPRALDALGLALHQVEIGARVNAQQLLVGCVARGRFVAHDAGGPQTRSDHLHAVGRFRMPDPADVVAEDAIGDEQHPAALSCPCSAN